MLALNWAPSSSCWLYHWIFQAIYVDTFITPISQVKKKNTRSICIEITCASSSNYKKVEMSQMSAAAAAKSLQSCPTLCDLIDGSPWGSPVPGILQARTLEWVAISFSSAWKWKVKVKSLRRAQPSAAPWIAAFQALQSITNNMQEWARETLFGWGQSKLLRITLINKADGIHQLFDLGQVIVPLWDCFIIGI